MTTQHDERAELIEELRAECVNYHGRDTINLFRRAAALLAADAQPQAVAQGVSAADVLAALDALQDEAAVHIFPSDLEKCSRTECAVEVYSVRAGNPKERTLPLFSREQVVQALSSSHAAPAAAQVAQPLTDWDFIRAHHSASQAGFLAGTSNWAHHMLRALRRGIGKDQAS